MPQCENISIFGSLLFGGGGGGEGGGGGGGGVVVASIIRLGPYWFTSTLSFILINMSNMEAIHFELKYENTLFFIGGGGGGSHVALM